MEKVLTPEFRVSFPAIFQPVSFQNQEPKYKVTMLFDKDQDMSDLKELAKKAIESKWPDPANRPKGLRSPFRDGDVDKPDVQGYENVIFINASSKLQPNLVDQNVQDIIDEKEFYAGCYARATVVAYAYDTAGNRGVAFGLQNIQKVRDGNPFSGRSNPEDDFAPVAVNDMLDTGVEAVTQQTDDMFA